MTVVWTADPLPRRRPRVDVPSLALFAALGVALPNRRIDLTPSFELRDTFGRTSADVDRCYRDSDDERLSSATARTQLARELFADACTRYLARIASRAHK